jgi:hypothetical protein
MLIRGGASHAFGFGEHIGLSLIDNSWKEGQKLRKPLIVKSRLFKAVLQKFLFRFLSWCHGLGSGFLQGLVFCVGCCRGVKFCFMYGQVFFFFFVYSAPQVKWYKK